MIITSRREDHHNRRMRVEKDSGKGSRVSMVRMGGGKEGQKGGREEDEEASGARRGRAKSDKCDRSYPHPPTLTIT